MKCLKWLIYKDHVTKWFKNKECSPSPWCKTMYELHLDGNVVIHYFHGLSCSFHVYNK